MINYVTYTNNLFGIEFQHPEYWIVNSPVEFYDQLNNVKTKHELFNRRLSDAKKPLIALSRYDMNYPDVNPTFKISINPLTQLKVNSMIELLDYLFKNFSQIFQDFRIRINPKEIILDGKKLAYGMAYYRLNSREDVSFDICSEIWLMHRGTYFFMIAASYKHNDKSDVRNDIKRMIDTMRVKE